MPLSITSARLHHSTGLCAPIIHQALTIISFNPDNYSTKMDIVSLIFQIRKVTLREVK